MVAVRQPWIGAYHWLSVFGDLTATRRLEKFPRPMFGGLGGKVHLHSRTRASNPNPKSKPPRV